jgi:hypothetical protein
MRRRKFVGFVLTAAASVLAGQAWTSAAVAQPEATPAAQPAGVSASTSPPLTAAVEAATSGPAGDTRQEALAKYWTADRMRAAIAADRQPGLRTAEQRFQQAQKQRRADAATGAATAKRELGPPARVGPEAPKGGSATATPAAWTPGYAAGHPVARTYGKVFFTNTKNGLNYVCSATVVNSEGRDTVWTAGHCVHGGSGGNWHANWAFVPAYHYGAAPYGVWSAAQLWTRTAWSNSSNFTEDMGVAILGTLGGWHIVDRVGGQGIAWNYSKNYFAYDFGYPAAWPYDGGRLIACAGNTAPEWVWGPWSADTIKLGCDMTGGSSGGAWLRWFDGNWGYINGVNSYKYNNDPNTLYSPYFDDAAGSLYNAVRHL